MELFGLERYNFDYLQPLNFLVVFNILFSFHMQKLLDWFDAEM